MESFAIFRARIRTDHSGQADLIIDTTGKIVTPL
jgi:hypothetical protein